MIDIRGKWALVTGASRGIGYLSAICLAEQGCNIVAHSRKTENCSRLLEELKKLGVEAYAAEAELLDPARIERMLLQIDEKGTPVSVILNNAGLQVGYRSDYLSIPVNDFDVSFRVNTTAPMMICYHFLPETKKKGFGRIINTTSGIDLESEQAAYSASKAALSKITRDLGRDFEGSDIIISLTDPGWCRTDLGGPNAPNDPGSAVPGVVVGVFVEDGKNGRLFAAQDFSGLTLKQAVEKTEMQKGVY